MGTPAIPALDPGPPGIIARAQYWFACLFVTGWTGVLCGGLYLQFFRGEQPCPLCVVQRLFMVLALLGAAHIVRQGLRGAVPRRDYLMGWGLALVGCTAGSLAAGRQALLYLLPGGGERGAGASGSGVLAGGAYDSGLYGSTVQGLPPDVWAWLFFQASVLAIGAVLVTSHLTTARRIPTQGAHRAAGLAALLLAGAVIAVSGVSVFLAAGLHAFLPVAPGRYQLLYDLGLVR